MVSLCLHPKSEGTKFFHGSFEWVLEILYPGLLGNALEESNKLVGEVAVATEVPHIGFTDKAEGEVEAKSVLKLIVDSLVKDKLDSLITDSLDKVLDQVEVATDELATDEEDSEEHTKLPKRSLSTLRDMLLLIAGDIFFECLCIL